jgi:hypothetical protein
MYLYPYGSIQVPAECKNVNATETNSNTDSIAYFIQTSFLIQQRKTELALNFIHPNYTIPGVGVGVELTNNAKTAVVVVVNFRSSQFNSTLFALNRSDNGTIWRMSFSNDFLAATIRNNVLYLYNSGLGYAINIINGNDAGRIVSIDNYRDVTFSNNFTNVQITAIIFGLKSDGAPLYEPNLAFNAIAYNCFISEADNGT